MNRLRSISENNSIYNSLKKLKYLRILTNEGKYLYNQNYKPLKTEIEKDFRR
jgi:hypothetical protein